MPAYTVNVIDRVVLSRSASARNLFQFKNMTSHLLFWGKHLLLSAICCLVFVIPMLSQSEAGSKPSIVVMPFSASGKAVAGTELADFLNNELVSSSKFAVIDKSKALELDADLLKGLNDSIGKAAASAIGQQTGAKYLVLGSVSEYGEKAKTSFVGVVTWEGNVKFNLRAIDAATADIIFSQTFEKHGISLGEAKSGAIMGSFGSKAMQDVVTKTVKDAATAIVKRLGTAAHTSTAAESTHP